MAADIHEGELPKSKEIMALDGKNAIVTSFRKNCTGELELRLFETEGKHSNPGIEVNFEVDKAIETDFTGNEIGDNTVQNRNLNVKLRPWGIHTYKLQRY